MACLSAMYLVRYPTKIRFCDANADQIAEQPSTLVAVAIMSLIYKHTT